MRDRGGNRFNRFHRSSPPPHRGRALPRTLAGRTPGRSAGSTLGSDGRGVRGGRQGGGRAASRGAVPGDRGVVTSRPRGTAVESGRTRPSAAEFAATLEGNLVRTRRLGSAGAAEGRWRGQRPGPRLPRVDVPALARRGGRRGRNFGRLPDHDLFDEGPRRLDYARAAGRAGGPSPGAAV